MSYDILINKPKINNVTLLGNQTAEDLGLISIENYTIYSLDNLYFFKRELVSKISDGILLNPNLGKQLIIQVTGNAYELDLEIQGQLGDEWITLVVVNKSNLNIINNISQNGLYTCDINGINKIRMEIKTINNGYVTVYGKIIK